MHGERATYEPSAPNLHAMRRCEIYSPKIDEELIPRLYRQARAEGRPMTEVASEAIRQYLERHAGSDAWRWPAEHGPQDVDERRAA